MSKNHTFESINCVNCLTRNVKIAHVFFENGESIFSAPAKCVFQKNKVFIAATYCTVQSFVNIAAGQIFVRNTLAAVWHQNKVRFGSNGIHSVKCKKRKAIRKR